MGTDIDSQTDLALLELLKSFKQRYVQPKEYNETPFQYGQVVGYGSDISGYDVPDIHLPVRRRIDSHISDIHAGSESQVVILAGEPGMGKSHLINSLRRDATAEQSKYIFVCNSNHWRVEEFEECLLDWMIAALTDPQHPNGDILLEKVKDIAFRALAQIATEPGELRKMLITGNSLRRFWHRLTGREESTVRTMIEQRDLGILPYINFRAFANAVALRFLPHPSDPFHRYVIMVLLRYLYESDRDYVIHWLRRRPIDPALFHTLGIADEVNRKYKCISVIHILVSLFTNSVSNRLKEAMRGSLEGRVFVLAFDQAEAREGLFLTTEDWRIFFTQLSELYNLLPNVFVLFTMTLGLREKYATQMERQFRDRIKQGTDYLLGELSDEDLVALYRSRVRNWLKNDKLLLDEYEQSGNPYFPFAQVDILGQLHNKTIRQVLDILDNRFRQVVSEVQVTIPIDYLAARNQYRVEQEKEKTVAYLADHLTVIEGILQLWGQQLAERHNLWFERYAWSFTDNSIKSICLQFHDQVNRKRWVRIWLLMLPHRFNDKIAGALRLLQYRQKDQNRLWLMRPDKLEVEIEASRKNQVVLHVFNAAHHTELLALRDILSRRERYIPSLFASGIDYLDDQFQQTYLYDVFRQARAMLNQLTIESEPEADMIGGNPS